MTAYLRVLFIIGNKFSRPQYFKTNTYELRYGESSIAWFSIVGCGPTDLGSNPSFRPYGGWI